MRVERRTQTYSEMVVYFRRRIQLSLSRHSQLLVLDSNMTTATPVEGLDPTPGGHTQGKNTNPNLNANRQRHLANLRKYGSPLPIILPQQSHPNQSKPFLTTYLPSFLSSSASIECPTCTGSYDPVTRSVIVTNKADIDILFCRGFFGKGTLSRSEPTWRERRLDLLRGGGSECSLRCQGKLIGVSDAAAEKIREERRLARKKFKIDRAQAVMNAAKAAEAIITGTVEGEAGEEGRPASPTPSTASTAVNLSNLNAQTFLVRPTRPDTNRNRGRKAFKRRPAAPQPNATEGKGTAPDGQAIVEHGPAHPAPSNPAEPIVQLVNEISAVAEELEEDLDEFDESLVEEMEHLQLGLEEAWFLSSALGVLRVYDPATVRLSTFIVST